MGKEETLMAVSWGLPTEGEEETGGEDIPSVGEGDSLAHQSLEETFFGWSQVLKASDELLPLTEEQQDHFTVSVIYIYLFFLYLFLFINVYLPSIFLNISFLFIPYIPYLHLVNDK